MENCENLSIDPSATHRALLALVPDVNLHPPLIKCLHRLHPPKSMWELPRVAQNRVSGLELLIAQWSSDSGDPAIEDLPILRFLATDPKVTTLLSKPSNGRNPLLGHYAVSHPFYTQSWHIQQDPDRVETYSLAQAQFSCAYARWIGGTGTLQAFESAMARGEPFVPGGHPAYNAALTLRFLSLRTPEATDLLDCLPVDVHPADYVDALLETKPPNWDRAIERFYALLCYLYKLQTGREYVPRKVFRTTSQGGSAWIARGDEIYGGSTTVVGDANDETFGAVAVTRVGDGEDDPDTVAAALDADISPGELNGGDDLFLCGEVNEKPSSKDRIRLLNLSRTQMRAMCRPLHLYVWADDLLSTSELLPLFQRALAACVEGATINELCCISMALVSYFASRSLEQACELKVFPPHARNSQAGFAIFLADDDSGSGDYWRLAALRPLYKTVDIDLGDSTYHPSDYVALPLPRILSRLIRLLIKKRNQDSAKHSVITLFPPASNALFHAVRELLAQIDPEKRLTPHRIQQSLFGDMVISSGGDLSLVSLSLAIKHPLAATELYYDGVRAEQAVEAYFGSISKVEQYCLPNLISVPHAIAASSAYIGCRYTPKFDAVIEEVSHIRAEASELARFHTVPIGDEAFERAHNYNVLYCVWWFGFACSARAGEDPVPPLHQIDEQTGLSAWSDKDDENGYKTKLIWVPSDLNEQLACLERHTATVRKHLSNPQRVKGHAVFFLTDGAALPVSPKSIAELNGGHWGFPANAHRRVMRQALRRANCPPAIIRAWMGWSTGGQEPWADCSHLSIPFLQAEFARYIPPLLSMLGFGPLLLQEGK
jgi:hypothetical protein